MPQQLQDHNLRQLSSTYLAGLKQDELLHLSKKLLHDLKEARERLNQNSGNSSKPPSSRAPWESLPEKDSVDSAPPNTDIIPAPSASNDTESETVSGNKPDTLPTTSPALIAKRKQGKQPGAQGHGRTWHPPVDLVAHHQASNCAACGSLLGEDATHLAYTAYDSVDIQWGTPERPGLSVNTTRNKLYESICSCGHNTRHTPYEVAADPLHPNTEVAEWRLIGPNLASLIVHLRLRSRLSVRLSQELLRDVLGIPLSVGALQQCYEEAAAGATPLEDVLVKELLDEALQAGGVLHVDETSWKERGEILWLWTFVSTLTVYFGVGKRTIEMLDNVIGTAFGGWLMSDGYAAYRHHPKRLRCWAHLIRKALGLTECLDKEGRAFGELTLTLFGALQTAIYAWREAGGGEGEETDVIRDKYRQALTEFRRHCLTHAMSAHDKTAALAKEFINDWEAVFRVLDRPWLPMTNNEAERALRHWVILRKANHGTKCAKGSRAFALLASISATCRLRGHSGLAFLADVVAAARIGQPLPALPTKVGV